MGRKTRFRPVVSSDREFLCRLYASTRQEELAPVPWSEPEKEAFLRLQFDAQDRHYQEHFPAAAFQIIELDAQPIGRLYVDRRADEIRLIDIALLPEFRGAGIGTALLMELIDEAAAAGKPLRIHVERFNPALRLYQRLGFRPLEEHGVYLLMEYRPS
ncbi:MAG TPA: GNAT family N-acetyltransferase [Acidobacteriota bacterium]